LTHIVGKPPSVTICIPSHDDWEAGFGWSLANLCGVMGGLVSEGILEDFEVKVLSGTYVHTARQALAEYVLERGSDLSLWLDSDMRFPRDAFVRLLKRRVDIVGANYSSRRGTPEFVSVKRLMYENGQPTQRCVTMPGQTGTERVEAIGFGCVLIDNRVFERLAERRPCNEHGPWFWYEWIADLGQQVGEDVYFCKIVRDLGFRVYVDHDLSHDVAHVGRFNYRAEHAQAFVEEIKRVKAGEEPKPELLAV
jgi:hypothetical protein